MIRESSELTKADKTSLINGINQPNQANKNNVEVKMTYASI